MWFDWREKSRGLSTWRLSTITRRNSYGALTGDTALRLGHFFGTSAEFWLNLQNLYELRLAEHKSGKAINPPWLPDMEGAAHIDVERTSLAWKYGGRRAIEFIRLKLWI